jgi:hypothetical protein
MDQQRTEYLKPENRLPAFAEGAILLTNVQLVPMTADTVLSGMAVYLEDGVIRRIVEERTLDEFDGVDDFDEVGGLEEVDRFDEMDAFEAVGGLEEVDELWYREGNFTRVDAEGRYLMPGLIDMHVHLWDRYELGLYLANGVTAVRNVWGMPMHLRMKEEAHRGEYLSPRIYTTGPKLTGQEVIDGSNWQLSDVAEARSRVRAFHDEGYDFVKTYYGLSRELFEAILEEASELGIDVVAHPTPGVAFSDHVHPQIRSIEHVEDVVQQALEFQMDSLALQQVLDGLMREAEAIGMGSSRGGSDEQEAFREMIAPSDLSDLSASNDPGELGEPHQPDPNTNKVRYEVQYEVRYCPTMTVFHNITRMLREDSILTSDSLAFMNPLVRLVDSKAQFERWSGAKAQDPGVVDRLEAQHAFHLEIVRAMHEAGVTLIAGTDAGIGVTLPGFSIHEELAFYREAGLSNFEVLRTATVNAAGTHGVMGDLGSIEEGKAASLLLLDGNPMEDLGALRDPVVVFLDGVPLGRDQLGRMKEQAFGRKNRVATGVRYLENLVQEW